MLVFIAQSVLLLEVYLEHGQACQAAWSPGYVHEWLMFMLKSVLLWISVTTARASKVVFESFVPFPLPLCARVDFCKNLFL